MTRDSGIEAREGRDAVGRLDGEAAKAPVRAAQSPNLDRIPTQGDEALVEPIRRTEKWLRHCSAWMLENDLDMTIPDGVMDDDPLDLADALAALSTPSQPPTQGEVTQEDRDRAADATIEAGGRSLEIRMGEADDLSVVQAFASTATLQRKLDMATKTLARQATGLARIKSALNDGQLTALKDQASFAANVVWPLECEARTTLDALSQVAAGHAISEHLAPDEQGSER